jgi:hypothetical protein
MKPPLNVDSADRLGQPPYQQALAIAEEADWPIWEFGG